MEGMKVGETRQLRIPPELAYGEEGYLPEIPPNATLIYEIALQDRQELPKATAVDEGDYTETDSGLKYVILEEGDGAEAKNGNTVTMEYDGWLTDGILFDSSLLREYPYIFTLGEGQVIAGWDEGIEGMKVGETRQLRIPPELAYAESGYPPYIPSDAELIFEVTLEDSKEPPEQTEVEEEEYTETDSGLQYTTLKKGDGDKAAKGNTVQVHYSGWLEDGTLFDTSRLRDIPYAFILGESQVIAGWDEGVEGMEIGEIRQLRIPPELAYAETGYPPYIPPDATLVFEVELLEIDIEASE
jgi:peptidylprolyl isomerase